MLSSPVVPMHQKRPEIFGAMMEALHQHPPGDEQPEDIGDQDEQPEDIGDQDDHTDEPRGP